MPKLEEAARRVVEHYSTTLGEELASQVPRYEIISNDIQHLRKAMGLLGLEIATEGGDVLKSATSLVTAAKEYLSFSEQPRVSAPEELIQSPKEKKLQELSARRETKELSPYDFDLNFVYQLNEIGAPLRREDVAHQTGIQAVVLSPEDLETLGSIDFIHRTGERMQVEPESLNEDDVLILYPEDLGNSEIEQADLKLLRETLKTEGITFKDFLDDDESIIDRIAVINRNRDAFKKERPENTEEIDTVAARQKNELVALYLQKYKERKAVKDETRLKLSNLLGDVLGGSDQA